MTVRYNVSVRSFSFWGDAINTRCVLSDEQCDMVEMVLRNEYGDAISACTLNDIFEYDRDYIANIVGYAVHVSYCHQHKQCKTIQKSLRNQYIHTIYLPFLS